MPYSTQYSTPRFSEEEIYNAIKAVKKNRIYNKLNAASNHLSREDFNQAYKGVESGSVADYVKDNSFLSGIASANYKIGAGISNLFGYEDTAKEWQQRGRELDAYHEINRGDSGFSNFLYGVGELVDPTLLIGGPAIKGLQAGTKVVNALSKNAAKTAAYGAGINASLTALDQDKSKAQVMQSAALGGALGGVLGGSAPLVVNKLKTGSFFPKDTHTSTTTNITNQANINQTNTPQDIHTSSTTTQGTNTFNVPNMNPNLSKDEQLAQNIFNAFLKKEANSPQNINDIALNYVKENHPKVYENISKPKQWDMQGDNFVANQPHKTTYPYNSSFELNDDLNSKLGIPNFNASLAYLYNKHPEMFDNKGDVYRLIKEVIQNPHYAGDSLKDPKMVYMAKLLNNGKFGDVAIHKESLGTIHANRRNVDKLSEADKALVGASESLHDQQVTGAGAATKYALSKPLDDNTLSMLNKPLNSIESNKRSLAFDYLKKHYPSLLTKTDLASGSLGGSANIFLGDENDSVAERFAKGFAAGLAGSKGIKHTPALYQYAKNSLNDFQTLAKENPQLFTRMLHKQALKEDFSHFIGTKALDIKPNNLITAKALKEKGISDELIFENTGWFIGKDNNWRFELSLDKSHVYKLKEGEYALNQMLKSEVLFKAYPHLKDIKVISLKIAHQDGMITHGSFNKNTNTITLNHNLSKQDFTKALIHEVQHAIQNYEGHALGSKPKSNSIKDYEDYKNTLGEMEANYTYKPDRGDNMLESFRGARVGDGELSMKKKMDMQEALDALQKIEPATIPKEVNIKEFLEDGLGYVVNKENFINHLQSKSDSNMRIKYLNLVEPTLSNPDVKFIQKDNRAGYIKAFMGSDKKVFYVLITDNDDQLLITGIPTSRIREVKRQLAKAENIEGWTQRGDGVLRHSLAKSDKSSAIQTNSTPSPLNNPLDDDSIMYSKNFVDFDPEQRTSVVNRALESIKLIKSQPIKDSLKQLGTWIKNNDVTNALFGTRIYTDKYDDYRKLRSSLEQDLSTSNAKAIDLHNYYTFNLQASCVA